jgi:NTE family protein
MPNEERTGVALCLSGGGFRSALFHLGAVRRLNELGLLGQLDTISAVSGGSIFAAHLAERIRPWPALGERVVDWEERVAAPFRAFTGRNLRTGPLLRRLLPWNWARPSTAVEALAQRLGAEITGLKLGELPDQPRFLFTATDMVFGVNWTFEKRGMGDELAGYLRPVPEWPVARAVAASACAPPFFDPLPLTVPASQLAGGTAPDRPARDRWLTGLRLSDGGLFDNLGLVPTWKDHKIVLVSDAGATFDYDVDHGLLWRLSRYRTIVGMQGTAARQHWLISNFISGYMHGAYWSIGSTTNDYTDEPETLPGYSGLLADDVISEVRTDLDAFSEAEIAVLENHGYLLAAAAVDRHVVGPGETQRYASHLNVRTDAPLAVPHPEWMDEQKVRTALKGSNKVKMPFGRR